MTLARAGMVIAVLLYAAPAVACPPPPPGPPPTEEQLQQARESRASFLGQSTFIASGRIARIKQLKSSWGPTWRVVLRLDPPWRGPPGKKLWAIEQGLTSCGPAPYYEIHGSPLKVGEEVIVFADKDRLDTGLPFEVVDRDGGWASTILRYAELTDRMKTRD